MNRGFRLRYLPLIVLPLLSFSCPGIAGEPELQKFDIPIQRNQSRIQKLQSGIEIHLGKLQMAGQQEFSLLSQVESLDRDLSLQRVRLEVLRDRLDSQQEILSLKKRDLLLAQTRHQQVKEHLQTRLRSYYLMGKTGILNVSFSTRTLPELMLFNDSFRALLDYDQKLIKLFRQSIDQLTLATEEHEQENQLLGEFISASVQQREELDAVLSEKQKLLHRVKSEKVLHEQALKEMNKAEVELRDTLAELKQQKKSVRKGFIMNKGGMPPPVKGILVRRFGEKSADGLEGENGLKGIIIDAGDGSPIKAIFAGRVIFAGYRRGYGNMVIIDHGLDYYTVTARMEKIMVENGTQVSGGDIIGLAGDIATLFEPGISFEIRHETEPLDPLQWITSDGLSLGDNKPG